jgi:hypothetical protein
MTRNELQIKLTDAIDGQLSKQELGELRQELQVYPDLLEAWEMLQEPVDLASAFPLVAPDTNRIEAIRNDREDEFAAVVITWFPRYLLAAGIAFLVMITIFRFVDNSSVNDQHILEWLHHSETELVFSDMDPILIPEVIENGD